jgi:hypothetical protein
MTVPSSGLVHQGCGGTFQPFTDGLTVEAGGYPVSTTWTEYHCDRCGIEMGEEFDEIERRQELYGNAG